MKLTFATAEPLSVARWNEHVATRKEDEALRTAIDAALDTVEKGRRAQDHRAAIMACRCIPPLRKPMTLWRCSDSPEKKSKRAQP